MIKFNLEVAEALKNNQPVVALESTVIAHGLPYPQNLETAEKLENIIRENGAIPATIAVFEGEFCIGLDKSQLERLATDKTIRKISRRDLPIAVAQKLNCATTVATTMFIAYRAGIKFLPRAELAEFIAGTCRIFRQTCPNWQIRRCWLSARGQKLFWICLLRGNGSKPTAFAFSAINVMKCPLFIHIRAVWQ